MAAKVSNGARRSRGRISVLFIVLCGVLLGLGVWLVDWLQPGPTPPAELETVLPPEARERMLQRVREREAKARAEMERQEAEERARRAALLAEDGAREAEARRQREEIEQRKAAAAQAQRTAAETEEAWKRFYQPSAGCRDPVAATRIECVNEHIKAKREFQAKTGIRSD